MMNGNELDWGLPRVLMKEVGIGTENKISWKNTKPGKRMIELREMRNEGTTGRKNWKLEKEERVTDGVRAVPVSSIFHTSSLRLHYPLHPPSSSPSPSHSTPSNAIVTGIAIS